VSATIEVFSFAYVFRVKVKITLTSECYSTETKILTLTCLQLSGQLSYADKSDRSQEHSKSRSDSNESEA
jgi:hypothetical protein